MLYCRNEIHTCKCWTINILIVSRRKKYIESVTKNNWNNWDMCIACNTELGDTWSGFLRILASIFHHKWSYDAQIRILFFAYMIKTTITRLHYFREKISIAFIYVICFKLFCFHKIHYPLNHMYPFWNVYHPMEVEIQSHDTFKNNVFHVDM